MDLLNSSLKPVIHQQGRGGLHRMPFSRCPQCRESGTLLCSTIHKSSSYPNTKLVWNILGSFRHDQQQAEIPGMAPCTYISLFACVVTCHSSSLSTSYMCGSVF